MNKFMVLSLIMFTISLGLYNLGVCQFTASTWLGVVELVIAVFYTIVLIFSRQIKW